MIAHSGDQIASFYGWWQFSVCMFAFFGLILIWYHLGRKRGDRGQVWLALSILCWSISGAFELIYVNFPLHSLVQGVDIAGWRSLLSLCNSLFILMALPWFRYLPVRLESIIKSKYWIYIVGIPFLFALFPTIGSAFFNRSVHLLSELDVYYAIMTLSFLGYVLWESFSKRGLRGLAWLTLGCILVTLAAQFFKLGDSPRVLILLSAIFKTCLIMIFFALALSWIKEVTEDSVFQSAAVRMELSQHMANGRLVSIVRFQGVGTKNKPIVLTGTSFDLLRRFAERRRGNSEGWLEIKPRKATRGKIYDINDYNEVKRLLGSILDGVYGKANWTREQEEQPWKRMLFEMSPHRERKIRLALEPEQITLQI